MKTKNIFRVFLTVIFVFGTMATNAQTKVYVHKTGGTDDEFNIADVDSISFTPPATSTGENLLVNPGFEAPDDGVAATVDPWTKMTLVQLQADESTAQNFGNSNRVVPGDQFWTNNSACIGVRSGNYAGRFSASVSAGFYQLVNVTPGKTYAFKAYVLHFQTGSSIIQTEYLRIKSADGTQELKNVAIGTENNTWMEVSGTVTIPSDYTDSQVRFQLSHLNRGGGNPSPTLIDDCEFYEAQ